MSSDYLYHGRIDPLRIGFAFASAAALANDAVRRHDCDPAAAHLLGRSLAAGLLLMPRLSLQERLNLHWRYPGVLRNILVDLRGDGRIRGLINPPHLDGLAADTESLFGGNGSLNVVTSRHGRILNSGTAGCPLLDPVADLAHYFSISEQVETELAVLIAFAPLPERPVALCRGLLLQAMPDTDLPRFERIRARLHHADVRELLARDSAADGHFEDILRELLRGECEDPRFHLEAGPPPRWFCTCGIDKFRASLALLNEADRADILRRGEPVRMRCDFCNRLHEFSPEEAAAIWRSRPPPGNAGA